jgi:hypothetical protein
MARRRNNFSFNDFNYVDGSIELFNNTIRNSFQYDSLLDDVFEARVITVPTPIVNDATALSSGADKNEKYIFRVRILGDRSPHRFLEDPCNLDQAKDDVTADFVFSQIQNHTEVFVHDTELGVPKRGDIVRIKLERTANSFNTRKAKQYLGIARDVKESSETTTKVDCEKLDQLFKNADFDALSSTDAPTPLSTPDDTNEFFESLLASPAFAGFSSNFLWGLTANAIAESGLVRDIGGDPESLIGKRTHDPIYKKCSWGYWQLNICSGDGEGTKFIEQNNLDSLPGRVDNTALPEATQLTIFYTITDKEKQFEYVAARMREIFPSEYHSDEISAYDAAYKITTEFENPVKKEEKGRQRGAKAEQLALTYIESVGESEVPLEDDPNDGFGYSET